VDGMQLKTHIAGLVTLKPDILQNTEQTASLSLTPTKDCQQKNNYVAQNCNV